MKILIDINHPAHVHYFRNFCRIMREKGHRILIVSRKKEITHILLKLYNLPYITRGKGKDGAIGKLFYMIYADFKLYRISREFEPDLFLNFLHPYPSQVAKLLGKASLVFSDTEHARLHHMLTVPFASKIFTPECYRIDLGKKHIRFKGFMELAYLHPNYYQPDAGIYNLLKVKQEEKYVIMRFVSWAAVHDIGHQGMSLENKRKAVKLFSNIAKVFISAEGPLPSDLEPYRINIPFDRMHDALYFSSLMFGESATMASESAVLGTPAIFIDNDGRGYTDEEERDYKIVFNFNESVEGQEKAITKGLELLNEKNSREKYKSIRNKIIEDCTDTTAFMVSQVLQFNRQPEAYA